jgi:hypothetical protein
MLEGAGLARDADMPLLRTNTLCRTLERCRLVMLLVCELTCVARLAIRIRGSPTRDACRVFAMTDVALLRWASFLRAFVRLLLRPLANKWQATKRLPRSSAAKRRLTVGLLGPGALVAFRGKPLAGTRHVSGRFLGLLLKRCPLGRMVVLVVDRRLPGRFVELTPVELNHHPVNALSLVLVERYVGVRYLLEEKLLDYLVRLHIRV